jgi:hypothetical protein
VADDAEILQVVQHAFAHCARPAHFTDYQHCEECAEHDELLRSRDVDTLRVEDVGNPGWDPLCYVSVAGLAYFFPALARLALSEPTPSHGWYAPQLLFHLTYDGEANRHLRGFRTDQRHAVTTLLRHLSATRLPMVDEWICSDDLRQATSLWSANEAPD